MACCCCEYRYRCPAHFCGARFKWWPMTEKGNGRCPYCETRVVRA